MLSPIPIEAADQDGVPLVVHSRPESGGYHVKIERDTKLKRGVAELLLADPVDTYRIDSTKGG